MIECKAEDCISRKLAENVFTKARMLGDTRSAKEIFAELPSVYPKSNKPSGKWIAVGWDCYRCSNCNLTKDFGGMLKNKDKFCPNCGTKMEQGDKK